MKKLHIIAILAVIAAIAILVIGAKDVTTYGNFDLAKTMTGDLKISGTLDLSKPIIYNPDVDPNSFNFYMKDKDGVSKKVILSQPKPQDFDQSESVVVTGNLKDDVFYAHDVLLKCPSKYKDEEIRIRAELNS